MTGLISFRELWRARDRVSYDVSIAGDPTKARLEECQFIELARRR